MKKLIIYLVFLLLSASVVYSQELTIEAPNSDPTLDVRGPEKGVSLFNALDWEKKENFLALFSDSYGSRVLSDLATYTALKVDKDMTVLAIVNGDRDRNLHSAIREKLNLDIPQGGFVIVASDSKSSKEENRRFLAEHFRVGDQVKLRWNGNSYSVMQILSFLKDTSFPQIKLKNDFLFTVTQPQTNVEGIIVNHDPNADYHLEFVQKKTSSTVSINKEGGFISKVSLDKGVNYVDVQLVREASVISKQSVAIFAKDDDSESRELVMWVEQFPNAKMLTNRDSVIQMTNQIKAAGFTAIGLDVKGPEGYVSYRKNDLSNSPYLTKSQNPKKRVVDTGFDLLKVVIEEAHKVGLKVYTSFNFFTEGNITTNDYAILREHEGWEEIVQRPEDKGKLCRITKSVRGKEAAEGKVIALAFVNPSNKEAQDFQLLRVEEVLKNYDVDGIILDRCRYDNLYADFSLVTRDAFEEYLQKKSKTLDSFPADAFRINQEGTLIKGKHFHEWITFRSQTIADFTKRLRELIESYKQTKKKDLKMAAYVGSWYETYYQNGVNWASENFLYDERLNFPESEIYGEAYSRTSFLEYLDFLMIGTYYKTDKEVNKYLTLGNILTCNQCPIVGSISLPDLSVENPGEVFGASLKNSSGLMIFDYCYVDWAVFIEQMKITFSKVENIK